jgi:hypothetical protein
MSSSAPHRPLQYRAITAWLAPLLVAATLAAGLPAHHAPAAPRMTAAGRGHTVAGARRLALSRALARARAVHHPVLVVAMTTATSTTAANPNGSLTQTQTLLATRARQHGTWAPLRATSPPPVATSFFPDPVAGYVAAWTQVDSASPASTSGWDKKGNLEVGDCNGPAAKCASIGVARSFLRMPVSKDLDGATIDSSSLLTTNDSAPSCRASAMELWTTGAINSRTDWANQPAKRQLVGVRKFAFGHSGCSWYQDDANWNITAVIQNDANTGASSETFGLYAQDEHNLNQWKKFLPGGTGGKNIVMTTTYTVPPAEPDRSTSPGGPCYTSATGAPVIGYDDVTFYATAYDAILDNNLTVRYVIVDPNTGTVVYDSKQLHTSVVTGDGSTAGLVLPRTQMAGLNGGGEYTDYWYATVTNSAKQTSALPSDYCYFTYNPGAAQIMHPGAARGRGEAGRWRAA